MDSDSSVRTEGHSLRSVVLRVALLLLFGAAIVVGGSYLRPVIARAGEVVGNQGIVGVLAYVAILAVAVVLVPLSSVPLLPLAATAWGVFLAGVLSIFGWWIGSLAAFLIGRQFGLPVLTRLVRTSRLEEWEAKLPTHATFFSIVLIRLVFPVEIPSYVLGLTKTVGFGSYAIASLIGMTPFAFVMVAMGGAVAAGQWFRFVAIGVGTAAAVYGLYLVWQRHQRPKSG